VEGQIRTFQRFRVVAEWGKFIPVNPQLKGKISHENSTSQCRSSAVVGLGNGTKRQRPGGP